MGLPSLSTPRSRLGDLRSCERRGQGAALGSWLDTFRSNKNSTHASFLEYSSSVLTGESRSSGRPREGAMSACRVAAPLRGRVTQPVDGSRDTFGCNLLPCLPNQSRRVKLQFVPCI